MNRKTAQQEAAGLAQQLIAALLGTLHGDTGLPGAQLRYYCGQLQVSLVADIAAGQLGSDLATCFDQARIAGAQFADFESILQLATDMQPVGIFGVAVANAGIRLSLIEQALVLAATTFTSRQDIDNYLTVINGSFDDAELVVADSLDNVTYQALINLHAAVAGDLTTRALQLPRIVSYTFQARMPSLWLAQRLYADGSRANEISQENKVVHPLFCPPTGVCLSQ